ncbi:MAG: hypothetical protein GC159_03920 [Phycisphaera sp.]|nr:hypothetical protein [Phycisphaera sp.]
MHRSAVVNPEPYNATIVDWRDCSDTLAVFTIAPDGGAVEPFDAGQYATIGLPKEHPPVANPDEFPPGDPRWQRLWRRAITMASSAERRDRLEFYAVRVDDGKMTPKLWHAWKRGPRRIWLDEHVRGEFTLVDVPHGRDLVMAGTTTGIAPYLSMYRTYRDTGRWRRFVLIEQCTRPDELGYRAELERYAAEDDTLIYLPTLTGDDDAVGSTWTGRRGGAASLFEPGALAEATGVDIDVSPDTCDVFLCGDPAMINPAEKPLLEREYVIRDHKTPGQLHVERYW